MSLSNVEKLIMLRAAARALPADKDLEDTQVLHLDVAERQLLLEEATTWVKTVIYVVRTPPDNPYGDDEEAIAGAILEAAGLHGCLTAEEAHD